VRILAYAIARLEYAGATEEMILAAVRNVLDNLDDVGRYVAPRRAKRPCIPEWTCGVTSPSPRR
jgi:hypothetical protein